MTLRWSTSRRHKDQGKACTAVQLAHLKNHYRGSCLAIFFYNFFFFLNEPVSSCHLFFRHNGSLSVLGVWCEWLVNVSIVLYCVESHRIKCWPLGLVCFMSFFCIFKGFVVVFVCFLLFFSWFLKEKNDIFCAAIVKGNSNASQCIAC